MAEAETAGAQTVEEISLTEKAAAQVMKVKAENNIPAAHGLRLGVKGEDARGSRTSSVSTRNPGNGTESLQCTV